MDYIISNNKMLTKIVGTTFHVNDADRPFDFNAVITWKGYF